MADEARKGAGFELIWAVWNRRKWLAILLVAAPFSAVVSLATSLPNIYRSTATVLGAPAGAGGIRQIHRDQRA
jgi:uncharacterized protein involved in exopolysaccharide biosynthesis